MKKIYNYKIVQLIICCLLFTGCDKYLDVTPKGKSLLITVADYDLWLNNPALYIGPSATLNYLSDDIDLTAITNPPTTANELAFLWAPQYTFDVTTPPVFWGDHYAKINLYNSVLVGIDEATGGTSIKKNSLKAEALLGRAFEYFYLVNLYGKPYDATTANQDLAVPFVTSNDVTSPVPPRSTVAEVYQHIIDDLNTAIPNLPLDNSANRLRGSIGAGYSVLARAYLYMRNYPEAQKNAELALANTNTQMIDYNNISALPVSPLLSIHPDVIYGRTTVPQCAVDLDFGRTFNTSTDQRIIRLYTGNSFTTRGVTYFTPALKVAYPGLANTNSGTSYQEMQLIAAECAARNSSLPLSTALGSLNIVRRNRYSGTPIESRDFSSTDPVAVLNEVLAERRRELAFQSLRWFDMRRFDKENRMGTVNRYNLQNAIIATLPPQSSKYTLQIPSAVLNFNPTMPQNP